MSSSSDEMARHFDASALMESCREVLGHCGQIEVDAAQVGPI